MDRPLLYLIDALPYVFRAFFAIREMRSPQGQPVNAVYGFATFLLQILQREPLTHIGVAFDESLTSSFRNAFFPAYKANRALPPPDLAWQLDHCQAVARALGLQVFVDHQYEADDLIGTLAQQATAQDMDMEVVVVAKNRRFDPPGVTAHLGVRPEQIPDFLGLQGDAVDNIPGVQGIGTKTALALLQAFPNLEALYTNLADVDTLPLRNAKTLRQKLEAGRQAAFLSRRLATIALDAPVMCTLEALRYYGVETTAALPLFEELGFRRLVQRLR
jgi:5'-3' exonuclease